MRKWVIRSSTMPLFRISCNGWTTTGNRPIQETTATTMKEIWMLGHKRRNEMRNQDDLRGRFHHSFRS